MKKRGQILNISCLNRGNNELSIRISMKNGTEFLKERANLLGVKLEHVELGNPTLNSGNQEVCMKLHMSESKEIIQSKATKVELVYA